MKLFLGCLLVLSLTCGAVVAVAQDSATILKSSGELKWGPAPPIFNKGLMMAVVSGDPSKEGMYVIRLKMPAGYKIMPHFHPTDENVTVLSGTFMVGMGDNLDAKTMTKLPAGGFVLLPANMHHYAMASSAATVQVHGMGPFQLTYVNPADDPSSKAAPAAK